MTVPFNGLSSKIKQTYTTALKNKSVLFTESDIEEADDELTGVPFEIRFAPALQRKPSAAAETRPTGDQVDPFAPPYQDGLFVLEDTVRDGEEEENLVILLNKFCVTPRHFLMVTKDFQRQTEPLTPLQILGGYEILKQLGTREKHLAFYNSGPESGASQPHKHMQFIPLSNGIAPFDHFIATHKPETSKAPFQLPLPYATFTVMLAPPESHQADYFASLFLSLLDLMIDHLRRLSVAEDGPAVRLSNMSYNVIMTENYLQVVPRTAESYIASNGNKISVNSLGFAGMVLVKRQEDLDILKRIGVLNILKDLGYRPVASGESSDEVPATAGAEATGTQATNQVSSQAIE